MDDIKGFIKDYWPYLLGGVVGIWLIMRFMGGSSQSSDGGYGAFLAAQAQAGAMQAASANERAAIQAQIDQAERADQRQYEFGLRQLEMEQNAINANAINQFQIAQAAMAESVSTGAAGVISALTQPSIHAMNSAAAENVAAMESAAYIAAAGYLAQSDMVGQSSKMVGDVSKSLSSINDAFAAAANTERRPGPIETVGNAVSQINRRPSFLSAW